ncbi:MAG TPA: four helix bundle protein [Chitinophagaceae bacterium]
MVKNALEKNPVVKLAFEFSLLIIEYCERLDEEKKFVVARQLLRAGTSVCSSIIEAQNSESKADFIHKFKIAAKEAGEAEYWLWLCQYSKNYPTCDHLLLKIDSLNKMIGKIISTSKLRPKSNA